MSWQASSWALKQRVGDPVLKILLLAAANYADPDGKCWPKVDTLAFDSEVSKRTIQRKLVELQKLGLIRVEQQFDRKGKQIESVIYLLMDGVGAILSPLEGGMTPECHGEGDTKLSPTESLNNHKNNHTHASKKKNEVPYSEDFEALWKQYPRTKNTSKGDAWNVYRMLNAERQEMVRRAVPLYAAAMKAEGRAESLIKHMVAWLRGKYYETASAPSSASVSASSAPAGPWYKTATREQWMKVLEKWQQLGRWSEAWGPEPGYGGCHVPADLVAAHNLKYRSHLFRQSDLDKFKMLVEPSGVVMSKHAVDTTQPAVP